VWPDAAAEGKCDSIRTRVATMVMTLDSRVATRDSKKVAVLLKTIPLSGNNLRQVVHTHVPLSPSGLNWYR